MEASQLDSRKEILTEKRANAPNVHNEKLLKSRSEYKWNVVWRNVIAFLYFHISFLYGFYLIMTTVKLYTCLFGTFTGFLAGFGVTAGAHRLWAHNSYKAKLPLRIILMIWQTLAFQNHIYEWVRDHRVHHKFTDTDADPHNSKRGFFFSHIGWLMLKKHPDVKRKGATINMSDLEKDPVVVWQRKLYLILMPLICFIIPSWIPVYFWEERPMNAWLMTLFRYTAVLNITWLLNSAGHMWGSKPYDRTISPTDEPLMALITLGEGWHNYHHVFPWDYKTGELGNYQRNFTTAIIDGFAKLGWAYDLKTVSDEMILKRASRTGDGTNYKVFEDQHEHTHDNAIWGWNDPDIISEHIRNAKILN